MHPDTCCRFSSVAPPEYSPQHSDTHSHHAIVAEPQHSELFPLPSLSTSSSIYNSSTHDFYVPPQKKKRVHIPHKIPVPEYSTQHIPPTVLPHKHMNTPEIHPLKKPQIPPHLLFLQQPFPLPPPLLPSFVHILAALKYDPGIEYERDFTYSITTTTTTTTTTTSNRV
eukprot:GHVR01186063.1.p1 GENE.GHVR01186063.1~~GHVR01186063.1.p1  ORF type:complete len:168 (+),score=35.51 GHVR01186063.1:95-598(+)